MKRIAFLSLLLLLALAGSICGQSNRELVRDALKPPSARTALVIGNGSYTSAPLRNPLNDASDVAAALKGLGFEVLSHTNVDQGTMKRAIREFGARLRSKGGVGLFYYAGHGVQVKGINYLVPVGTEVRTEEEVEYESVEAGLVLAQMEAAKNDINIVILDACRNNPFARSYRSADKGLAQINAPSGTLIAYSTAPGSIASDGTGRNGLYTQELLKQIKTPDRSIEDVFKQVRISVRAATGGSQTPWESSSLTGEFYFNQAGLRPKQEPAPLPDTSLPTLFRRVENSIGVILRPIRPGEFKMGSPGSRETSPVRSVRLGEFWMSAHEITIGQWKKVMGELPVELARGDRQFRETDDQPVVYVSWNDAKLFIDRLNAMDKLWQYRLPTEAEWEYACRAGTTTYYSFGNDLKLEQANFDETMLNSEHGNTKPVMSYKWNEFGLHDMHGNVWEWVEDAYSASYAGLPTDGSANTGNATTTARVFRGGSWANDPGLLRSDVRRSGGPNLRDSRVGFRIVAVQKLDTGANESRDHLPASATRLPLTVSESMFTFALQKCTRSGTMVMCNLTITNDDKIDKKLEVPFPDSANGRTFDDQGNQSELDSWQIGQTAGREATLIPGIGVSAVVRFKGVSPQATTLKRIDLGFQTAFSEGGYYKRRDVIVRFTEVPL